MSSSDNLRVDVIGVDPAMQLKIRLIVPHFCRQKAIIQQRIGSVTVQHHVTHRPLLSHSQPWTR